VGEQDDLPLVAANNLTTTHSYEIMHRRIQSNFPDAGQGTACFSEVSGSTCYNSSLPLTITQTQKINSALTKTAKTVLDGLARVIETQITSDPQGTVFTDTSYDALGRVTTVSNPYRSGTDPTSSPGITTFVYDALGRKCVEVPPDGTAVPGNTCPASAPAKDIFTSYSGNTTTVTDAAGRKRQSTTDALGRLTQVVEDPGGLGYITNYSYDALGNLTSVVQNGSHQRTFTYNSLSQLLTSTNPETGTICYGTVSAGLCQNNGYDADGNLVAKTDARGITTTYTYDALNREISRAYSNGDPTITTHYDEANCLGLAQCANIGHRTSMTDAAGSESWSFDVVDRMHRDQRTTGGITKITTYNLDFAGNITSVTYPTNRVVNYAFDAANRPSTAADGSNGITYATGMQSPPSGCSSSAACYTPQGAFYALSIGQSPSFTGLNLTHLYNARLQSLEFQASSTGGNAIDISYSFVDPVSLGNAGHVFSTINNLNPSRTQTFTYDSLNRITSAGTAATSGAYCWGYQYGYDAWGNLLYQQAWVPNYTGCSEFTMAPVTADANNHISAFAYDVSGNATNDGAFAYTWDAESQMKTAAGVTYTYDGDGRRVSKSNGKIYWYGSGGDILAETDAAGNTLNEYIFFGGKRVAMLPSGSSPLYYVPDLLGTSRVMTSSTGVVCYDADFDPYGGEHAYINTCPQNYKFEGKERDTETGNDDFGARYYTSRFGRWLSADWSSVPVPVPYANLTNPQTLNLYAMVADDPESFADLDGHCEEDACVLESAAGYIILKAIAWTAAAVGAVTVAKVANDSANDMEDTAAKLANSIPPMPSESEAYLTIGSNGNLALTPEAQNLVNSPVQSVDEQTKQEVKNAAGGKCEYCGQTTRDAQKSKKGVAPAENEGQTDHYKPRSKGGTDDKSNLAHACRGCNRSKSDADPTNPNDSAGKRWRLDRMKKQRSKPSCSATQETSCS
jgi:RHS repeat-associated protein